MGVDVTVAQHATRHNVHLRNIMRPQPYGLFLLLFLSFCSRMAIFGTF